MLDKSKSKGEVMKVGDKVRVIGSQSGGCWSVGHEGYILELRETDCRVSDEYGERAIGNWYQYGDLELMRYDWDVTKDSEQGFTISGLDTNTTYTFRAEGTQQDNVNHPSHYGNGSIECIDYLEDFLTKEEFIGYLRGNIGKYLHRWRYKNGLEDLRKAEWYLTKLIGVMEDET
jgi:hypothetical protein